MTSAQTPAASDVAAERPEPGDTYFLAVASLRVRGHRFVWGQPLPDAEGKKAHDHGFAVRGAENLRNSAGQRLPHPAFREARSAEQGVVDTGSRAALADGEDTVEVSGPDGMTTVGATGVNDSQSGPRTTRRK